MLSVEKIDTRQKDQVRRFVRLPFRLYQNHPQWVPPLLVDAEMQLNRDKHPYYEHSAADFFIARRDGRDPLFFAPVSTARQSKSVSW